MQTDSLLSRPIINPGNPDFRAKFNRASFAFPHALGHHPLLTMDRLVKVAERILSGPNPQRFAALYSKPADTGAKFSSLAGSAPLTETIRQLGTGGSWLKLTRTQDVDPDHKALMESVLAEVEEQTGVPLKQEITWASLTIFLASPNIVTPYHIDHESNFLFQIEGEKDLCLFDPTDRELLPEKQIERFYLGNVEAANYNAALQDRGTMYRLKPGLAVHHPPLAPHWLKNGDNISISASIGFCMRDLDRRAKIHQANLILRQLGLSPKAPGVSPQRDRLKVSAMSALSVANPQNQDELLFSGIRKVVAPLRMAKKLLARG
jgi:hypothetical protein